MTTILNGLLGGLLTGLVAGVVTQLVTDDPSATAEALKGRLGNRVATSRWGEFAVQLSYGGLAGGVLVALELYVLGMLAVPPTIGEALGIAVTWSALLFGTQVVFWRVVSSPLDRSHLVELLAYHLVYGLGLGAWIRMTWIT